MSILDGDRDLHVHIAEDVRPGEIGTVQDLARYIDATIKPLLRDHHAVLVPEGTIDRARMSFASLSRVPNNLGGAQFHVHDRLVTLLRGTTTSVSTLLASQADVFDTTVALADSEKWRGLFSVPKSVRSVQRKLHNLMVLDEESYLAFIVDLQNFMANRLHAIDWSCVDIAAIRANTYHARDVRHGRDRPRDEVLYFKLG